MLSGALHGCGSAFGHLAEPDVGYLAGLVVRSGNELLIGIGIEQVRAAGRVDVEE